MHDWHVFLLLMTMTPQKKNRSSGIPAPITKLTYEQDLRLRLIHDNVDRTYESNKEDVITFLMALQHQNFVLSNSLTNLVEKWPKDQPTTNGGLPMFGILLETKD